METWATRCGVDLEPLTTVQLLLKAEKPLFLIGSQALLWGPDGESGAHALAADISVRSGSGCRRVRNVAATAGSAPGSRDQGPSHQAAEH